MRVSYEILKGSLMKIILLLTLLSGSVFAQNILSIENSHQVDRNGQIFRGREPKKLVHELKDLGITDVIIFKNEVRTEVTEEKVNLKNLGIRYHHIPFLWKDLTSLRDACRQTIRALRIMKRVKLAGGKVYFHCTAGEDRTGLLAGVYRMLEDGISGKQAFEGEMCRNGYADGNPGKPVYVVSAIEKGLTPLFLQLAESIEAGSLRMKDLSYGVCEGMTMKNTDITCR